MKTHAFPLQLAKEAILLEKYSDAIALLKPLSIGDDLEAQFLHAYLHFWDDELSQSQAIQLMTDVAAANHAEANYILSVCPHLSPGYIFKIPDNKTLFDYLSRAVELGSEFALVDLAECYLKGVYVTEDVDKARQILQELFDSIRNRTAPSNRKLLSKCCFLLGNILLNDDKNSIEAIRLIYASTQALDGLFRQEGFEVIQHHMPELVNMGAFDEQDVEKFEQNYTKHLSKSNPTWQKFIHYYCSQTLHYDLRGASADIFMDFIFDHFPLRRSDFDTVRWNRHAEVIFSPPEILKLYTEIFQNAKLIVDRYSEAQIIQGFGMETMRGWENWTIGCVLSDASSSVEDGTACIRAMYQLFVHIFSRPGFIDTGFMWWDIGYGACGNSWRSDPTVNKRQWKPEEWQLHRQATFETQVKVLHMKSYECQRAAIHGLGHHPHLDREKVLRQYIDDNPDLQLWLLEYALAAIKGEIS